MFDLVYCVSINRSQITREGSTMIRKQLFALLLTAVLGVFQANLQAQEPVSVSGGGTGGSTGDVIVIPNAQADDEYTVNAGGTSKGGEVPVTPG
jgi:hypothetical protein